MWLNISYKYIRCIRRPRRISQFELHALDSSTCKYVLVVCLLKLIFRRIDDFAGLYSEKLGLNKTILCKTLWGDFYFNNKTKKVHKGAQVSDRPLCSMYMGVLVVNFYVEKKWYLL